MQIVIGFLCISPQGEVLYLSCSRFANAADFCHIIAEIASKQSQSLGRIMRIASKPSFRAEKMM
ncbi:hypothetical protein CU100_05105 [Phyllobacterium endophyticum]|uniref:Uncharacterized protein n=1 Tax=Phyllobacterium endophyticum TaxID=1149773 RepID=A0A2P7B0W9_9HYPH|nr:hypothetical protein CU100_05105 [Phyllobacterium endophyticum]